MQRLLFNKWRQAQWMSIAGTELKWKYVGIKPAQGQIHIDNWYRQYKSTDQCTYSRMDEQI